MRPRIAHLLYETNPKRIETRVLDWLPHHMPRGWINHLTMGNLGRLTAQDPELKHTFVPAITLEEIGQAMRKDEHR